MATFNHQDGHHVETDGARIYYEEQGDRHGPALVFLHGGFGDIETFNAITPQLGKRWRLIGIDSRGQGKSTLGGAALSYKRLQQDVEAVIRTWVWTASASSATAMAVSLPCGWPPAGQSGSTSSSRSARTGPWARMTRRGTCMPASRPGAGARCSRTATTAIRR